MAKDYKTLEGSKQATDKELEEYKVRNYVHMYTFD